MGIPEGCVYTSSTIWAFGAAGGTWTLTRKERASKTRASTNFATTAYLLWCPKRDSNSHTFRYWNLNPACLPISPSGPIFLHHFYMWLIWCDGRDLNPQSLRHVLLRHTCIPIPPPSHCIENCCVNQSFLVPPVGLEPTWSVTTCFWDRSVYQFQHKGNTNIFSCDTFPYHCNVQLGAVGGTRTLTSFETGFLVLCVYHSTTTAIQPIKCSTKKAPRAPLSELSNVCHSFTQWPPLVLG